MYQYKHFQTETSQYKVCVKEQYKTENGVKTFKLISCTIYIPFINWPSTISATTE